MHSQHVFSQQPEIMHGKKAWHSNECPSDNTLLKSYTWDLHVYKLKTVPKAASCRVKCLCFSLGLSCSTASAWWCGLTCLSLLGTGNALLSIGTVALQLLHILPCSVQAFSISDELTAMNTQQTKKWVILGVQHLCAWVRPRGQAEGQQSCVRQPLYPSSRN